MTPEITTQFITNTLQDKNVNNNKTFKNKLKPRGKVKKEKELYEYRARALLMT